MATSSIADAQVVQSVNWTPVLYTSNGMQHAEILPGTNIPYGYQAVPYSQWLQVAQMTGVNGTGQPYVAGKTLGQDYGQGALASYLSDPTMGPVVQQWQQGNLAVPSGQVQVKDSQGNLVWTTTSDLSAAQTQQLGVINGSLVQLPDGTTVPKNSAAAQAIANPVPNQPTGIQQGGQTGNITTTDGTNYTYNGMTYSSLAAAKSAATRGGNVNPQVINNQTNATTPAGTTATNTSTISSAASTENQGITPDPNHAGSYLFNGVSYSSQSAATAAQQRASSMSSQGGSSSGTTGTSQDQANMQAAIQTIQNSSLDAATKQLFENMVQNWQPGQEINVQNIINEFDNELSSTIDPYYQELANTYKGQAQQAYQNLQQNNATIVAQNTLNANQAITGEQQNLEANGLTFSGEAQKQLGTQSAYGTGGTATEGGAPVQIGGPQGLIQQGNQLISSSTSNAYQQNLNQIAQDLETEIGSSAAGGLIPGGQLLGGVNQTASTTSQQQQEEGSVLQNLYSQAQGNFQASQNINPLSQ